VTPSGPHKKAKLAKLSKSLRHRLDTYAIAASAAGVGILASAQTSEAKVVYTPANIPISGIVSVDLNNDGIVDFGINLFGYGAEAFMAATSIGQNRVWGDGFLASHLLAGVLVGPNPKKFALGNVGCGPSSRSHTCKAMNSFFDFSGYFSSAGPWAKTKNGYLGLKFYIKGKVHFGWARLHRAKLDENWVLTGYAYETVARKPIITGQKKGPEEISSVGYATPLVHSAPDLRPTTLSMLALGSPALSIRRREQPTGTGAESN
jgi:hypothetical protein